MISVSERASTHTRITGGTFGSLAAASAGCGETGSGKQTPPAAVVAAAAVAAESTVL